MKILEAGEKVLASVKELILQPQSEIDKVRSYLLTHGYVIAGEKMVYEDGKYYPCHAGSTWGNAAVAGGGVTVWKISAGRETSGIRGISERQTENLQENTGKTRADGKKAEKITARQKELEDELRLIGQALEVYER